MIPPQGTQKHITPYAVKLATALLHEYVPDNFTRDTDIHMLLERCGFDELAPGR